MARSKHIHAWVPVSKPGKGESYWQCTSCTTTVTQNPYNPLLKGNLTLNPGKKK